MMMMMSWSAVIVLLLPSAVVAWVMMPQPMNGMSRPLAPSFATFGSRSSGTKRVEQQPSWSRIIVQLLQSSGSSSVPDESSAGVTALLLSQDEQKMVQDIYDTCCRDNLVTEPNNDMLKATLLQVLPTLPAKLIVKLRQLSSSSDSTTILPSGAMQAVVQQVNAIVGESLETAKQTLLELLNAGEVRKLDSLIGKAAREGRLDVAFFNVLAANLRDASAQEGKATTAADPPRSSDTNNNEVSPPPASRWQILQHVYTRCQEEVEKIIPPGIALLNKLLRTEQESIRANLYGHYLTPQKTNVIVTPDGKRVELPNTNQESVLVPLEDFCKAIGNAVLQIRTVEKSGGTDAESAAAMVESCRQIAKEARVIIGDSYGRESDELQAFEEALMPVFRPSSPESPYIQGQSTMQKML